jgi:hypothetical protein
MEGQRESAYLLPMRRIVFIAALFIINEPALSMNWEGHDDDWHKDLPFAQAFRDAVGAPPLAKPLPPCDRKMDNMYDQVPIEGKNCISVQKPIGTETKPSK